MGAFSLTHILIIVLIAVVFFGSKRLPELGKSLGEAIRGFKKGISDDSADEGRDVSQQINHEPKKDYTASTQVNKDKQKQDS